MNKLSKLNVSITLIISMLVYVNSVTAKDCYEKSPNLITKKDEYYNLDATKTLSNEEKDKLDNLFRSIEGKWKGESVEIECKGPDRAPVKKYKNSTIATNIRLNSNSSLKIKADAHYVQEKVTRLKNLNLLGDSHIFELEFTNNNNVIFSERYRISLPKNSRLVETIYDIKLNRNSLLILRSYYTNGVYTGEEKWSMSGI